MNLDINISQFKNEPTINFVATVTGVDVKSIKWEFSHIDEVKYGFSTQIDIDSVGEYSITVTVTDSTGKVWDPVTKTFIILENFRSNNVIDITQYYKIPLPNLQLDTFGNSIYKIRNAIIKLDELGKVINVDGDGNIYINSSFIKHPVTGEWLCELNFYEEEVTIKANSSHVVKADDYSRPLVNLNARVFILDQHKESISYNKWLIGDTVIIQAYDFTNNTITFYNTRDTDYKVKIVTNFKRFGIPPSDLI